MRNCTKFISKTSAPTISTSFDFHDLVKGRFSDVYRFMSRHNKGCLSVCLCVGSLCAFLSRSLGPVHTNQFSNENGAVLLQFQKELRPHLSFSYLFRPSTLQRRSREKPHGSVCPPFWILTFAWSSAVVSILMTSPCSDSIVFVRPH